MQPIYAKQVPTNCNLYFWWCHRHSFIIHPKDSICAQAFELILIIIHNCPAGFRQQIISISSKISFFCKWPHHSFNHSLSKRKIEMSEVAFWSVASLLSVYMQISHHLGIRDLRHMPDWFEWLIISFFKILTAVTENWSAFKNVVNEPFKQISTLIIHSSFHCPPSCIYASWSLIWKQLNGSYTLKWGNPNRFKETLKYQKLKIAKPSKRLALYNLI